MSYSTTYIPTRKYLRVCSLARALTLTPRARSFYRRTSSPLLIKFDTGNDFCGLEQKQICGKLQCYLNIHKTHIAGAGSYVRRQILPPPLYQHVAANWPSSASFFVRRSLARGGIQPASLPAPIAIVPSHSANYSLRRAARRRRYSSRARRIRSP